MSLMCKKCKFRSFSSKITSLQEAKEVILAHLSHNVSTFDFYQSMGQFVSGELTLVN